MWGHPDRMIMCDSNPYNTPGFQRWAVLSLAPEDVEAMVEKAAEEIGLAIAGAFVRGQCDTQVITEKREDYVCARAVLQSVLGPLPKQAGKAVGK